MVSWMVMWNCESELNLVCKKSQLPLLLKPLSTALTTYSTCWFYGIFLCAVGVLWCCVVYYNGGTFLRTYKAPQYNDMAMMQER